MTTKTFDTTVSQLLQDDSSVEYVAPEQNPVSTIPNDAVSVSDMTQTSLFDFNAVHNGEACIESHDPRDRGTEHQFWFTIALFVAIYNESGQTIRNNIESLYRDGELGDSRIFERRVSIEDACGVPHKTAIYNLEVLNKLGMCCFRGNKKAKEIRNKFNDVLVKHETGVAQPEMSDEEIMSRALEIAHRTLALREERIKALEAERDEAIRTKTQYQSNLAAQMSGRVGGLTSALNRVKAENDRLKGDRFTVDDVYIIMNISDVSFTHKDPKAVIRDSLNLFSKEMGEPFPKVTIKQKEINGKTIDVSGYTYTTKTVQAYFEFVDANPLGWQARNRKMIMYGWLREKLIPSI